VAPEPLEDTSEGFEAFEPSPGDQSGHFYVANEGLKAHHFKRAHYQEIHMAVTLQSDECDIFRFGHCITFVSQLGSEGRLNPLRRFAVPYVPTSGDAEASPYEAASENNLGGCFVVLFAGFSAESGRLWR
jgi:hypothetical protein